ncbi:hypothetical protein BHM03_00055284 [Ensete ventricosum]|nr:hypothetical protein BHM03_00055284 [Ensete ventricosum]
MGRSDSSKPTPDGQPRQHFGGSHVSPRDQVDSPSVIRGGGPGTTLPGPTPINIAWRAMPSPYAAAAARPPYVSVTTQGTTKVLGVRTSSPLTSIKHPFRQQTAQGVSRSSSASRTTEGASTHVGSFDPTDVGGLVHLDENRSSRHLSSTPEISVTFLAQEGGPMSQECPTSNPNTEHPGGSIYVFPSTLQPVSQAPRVPAKEASTMLPTPNRYWRLFNDRGLAPPDPGHSPITPGLGPPDVTTEAFLDGEREAPQSRPSQGEHPRGSAPHPPVEATIENPNASVSQPPNRSRDVMRLLPEPDVVSSDSTNSVRKQLCQVNQRLDEVQRDFVRSKEEVEETTKGGYPFAPKILDKPIPSNFRLPTLEPYDGSTDLTEHVAVFIAQMALYDTSNALIDWRQGSGKITRNPEVTSLKDNLLGHPEEETGQSYRPLGLSRSRSIQPELREGDDAYPDHDDALVISAQIANAQVKSVMVDTGRFTGDSVSLVGTAVLPITIGEEPRSKTLLVSFIVVALPSAYNTIIGRPMLNKLRAVVSMYHRVMKFPTKVGVGEVRSDPRESRKCYLTATTLPKKLKVLPPTHGIRDSSKASPKPEPT